MIRMSPKISLVTDEALMLKKKTMMDYSKYLLYTNYSTLDR